MKEVNKDIIKRLRVNERIIAREVRLVGEKGEQLGIMPLSQALETAKKRNLDLIEVAATATPPVCRILDYGKYKYEQAKKERELRRSQRVMLLREVRIRPKISDHDFEAKAKLVRKLLNEKDKVKVSVLFRGREITHPELGRRLLQRMSESVKGVGALDGQPSIEGKRMNLIFSPVVTKRSEAGEEKKEA